MKRPTSLKTIFSYCSCLQKSPKTLVIRKLPEYSCVVTDNVETQFRVLNIFHAFVPSLYACVDQNTNDEEKLQDCCALRCQFQLNQSFQCHFLCKIERLFYERKDGKGSYLWATEHMIGISRWQYDRHL